MRSLAIVALALVLVLLAWFLLRSEGDAPPLEPSAPAAPLAERGRPASPVESTTRPADRAVVPSAPPPPACAVLGRVVDDAGQPLAGADVRLSAHREWAAGIEVPLLPGRFEARGWELRSDASGHFRFDVPLPTVETVRLEILPDSFHESVFEFVGGGSPMARAALRKGENDLGPFRLKVTGAIRGKVTDAAGIPLAGVQLDTNTPRWSTSTRQPESDAQGGYTLEHIEPGVHSVRARREGYLLESREAVEVQRERVTGPVDFVLRAAPVISGIVVDESGQGLAGAELRGAPSSMRGAGAIGQSSADGRFRIYLPQDEPYTLRVTLAGYESFGLDDLTTHYAPNTMDLRIVLERSASATTHFVVVDASSGAKLEIFGLEIERDRGSAAGRRGTTSYNARPKPLAHPGGELDAFARPGLDRFTVTAPGYVRARGDVAHDSSLSPIQVVKLARGGSLRGRAVIAGQPAPGARGLLETDSDESLTLVADDDGRFRFESLEAGTYRLALTAVSGESNEFAALRLGRGVEQDLGDLELRGAARILGRVLVPAGRASSGLVVHLDNPFGPAKQSTDADGRFRFEGVPAGEHVLLVDELPGVLAAGATASVTLGFGETREVLIDARDRGACKVSLAIELPGHSLEGVQVSLRPVAHRELSRSLGRPDAQGRVVGWAPAAGDAQVVLLFPDGIELVHPTALVPLELDHDVDLRLRFEVGAIRIEIPLALQLPALGQADLVLRIPGQSLGGVLPRFTVLGKEVGNQHGLKLEADGRHFLAGLVAAGEYEAIFSIHAEKAEDPGAGRRLEQVQRSTFRVVVRAGDTVDIQLR